MEQLSPLSLVVTWYTRRKGRDTGTGVSWTDPPSSATNKKRYNTLFVYPFLYLNRGVHCMIVEFNIFNSHNFSTVDPMSTFL